MPTTLLLLSELNIFRNNYYTIEGDYNKLITQQYTLHVIVNPNWDQKVSLTLEEAGDGTSN